MSLTTALIDQIAEHIAFYARECRQGNDTPGKPGPARAMLALNIIRQATRPADSSDADLMAPEVITNVFPLHSPMAGSPMEALARPAQYGRGPGAATPDLATLAKAIGPTGTIKLFSGVGHDAASGGSYALVEISPFADEVVALAVANFAVTAVYAAMGAFNIGDSVAVTTQGG